MKKILIIFILILALSCNKDKVEDPTSPELQVPIISGTVNDDMYYFEFNPELILDYSWTACGIGKGKDSIDLNNDNIFDLFLDVTFLDQTLFWSHECCPPPMDCLPPSIWYKIYGSNNIEIASYYEIWDDSLLWSYADTIPLGYQIDTISKWENRTKLWCLDTPVSHGAWFNLDREMYIGIRLSDSSEIKYGWIKASGSSDNNIIFRSFSIEK